MADGLNAVDKRYIYQFMNTFQLPGSIRFYLQIQMHTVAEKRDGSLAKEFQEHLTKKHRKNGFIDQEKSEKGSWK